MSGTARDEWREGIPQDRANVSGNPTRGQDTEDQAQKEERASAWHLPLGRGPRVDLRIIILVAILAISYIWLRNTYDRLCLEEQRLQEEVQHLRSHSLAITAELMKESKESTVFNLQSARGLGLEESQRPPVCIKYQERD